MKGAQATYIPAPDHPGYNSAGIEPLGPNVLVRIDEAAQHSMGGVLLVDDQVERMTMASETGTIWAMGKTAYAGYADEEKPKVGDRIVFQRYAGVVVPVSADGGPYRVMDDTCICGRQIAVPSQEG